jgi:hypothetical protein
MKHRQYPKFPLDSISGRVALLLGVLNQQVTDVELKDAMLHDTQPRPHVKPVVVEGIRFASVTDAAHWLYRHRPALAHSRTGLMAGESAAIDRLKKRVSRWATQDCWAGYYWAE